MSPRIIQHRRYQKHGVTSPNGTPISVKQKLRLSPTGAVGKFFSVAKPCCNCGLVPSTGERCSPLQIYCRGFIRILYSIFKLQTRCRKCFSVRSEPLIVFTLLTLTECFLIHCYLAGYSIWDNILILIPKITTFVA